MERNANEYRSENMNRNSQLVLISTMNRLSTQRSNKICRLMMTFVFFSFERMFVDDCFPSSKNSRYSMYIHSDISDKYARRLKRSLVSR